MRTLSARGSDPIQLVIDGRWSDISHLDRDVYADMVVASASTFCNFGTRPDVGPAGPMADVVDADGADASCPVGWSLAGRIPQLDPLSDALIALAGYVFFYGGIYPSYESMFLDVFDLYPETMPGSPSRTTGVVRTMRRMTAHPDGYAGYEGDCRRLDEWMHRAAADIIAHMAADADSVYTNRKNGSEASPCGGRPFSSWHGWTDTDPMKIIGRIPEACGLIIRYLHATIPEVQPKVAVHRRSFPKIAPVLTAVMDGGMRDLGMLAVPLCSPTIPDARRSGLRDACRALPEYNRESVALLLDFVLGMAERSYDGSAPFTPDDAVFTALCGYVGHVASAKSMSDRVWSSAADAVSSIFRLRRSLYEVSNQEIRTASLNRSDGRPYKSDGEIMEDRPYIMNMALGAALDALSSAPAEDGSMTGITYPTIRQRLGKGSSIDTAQKHELTLPDAESWYAVVDIALLSARMPAMIFATDRDCAPPLDVGIAGLPGRRRYPRDPTLDYDTEIRKALDEGTLPTRFFEAMGSLVNSGLPDDFIVESMRAAPIR